MASAFASIVIYAIDLVPHRVLWAASSMPWRSGIVAVFKLCSWLPALGLLTVLLPRPSSGTKAGVRGRDVRGPFPTRDVSADSHRLAGTALEVQTLVAFKAGQRCRSVDMRIERRRWPFLLRA